MAKMSAIYFNLSMARYPSQRRFESRERVSNRFCWPEKRGHAWIVSVQCLSQERIGKKPVVFRFPLSLECALPQYPTESTSELQASVVSLFTTLAESQHHTFTLCPLRMDFQKMQAPKADHAQLCSDHRDRNLPPVER